MPTYEYACTNCGNQWEEVQKISEAPLTACPKCSQSTAKRQISGGNFILKGGGWYSDLYSSPKPAAKGGESKGESAGKSEGGAAKKESSPPAKTESSAPKAASSSSSDKS